MNDAALADAYVSLRHANNDLRIVSGTGLNSSGFTLLALLQNELYFLPEFLSHYRRLGVERFVFLNDCSSDGSKEYLLDQSDTVIVESKSSYGDFVSIPSPFSSLIKKVRMMVLWRSMLHDLFADEQWALQVDLDEFIWLPDGMIFQDIFAHLERENVNAVWGVMLDVYPKNILALRELERITRLDISASWYFDGEQHLRLRRHGSPKFVHPGARARLYQTYKLTRLYNELGVRKMTLPDRVLRYLGIIRRPLHYNALWKPTLLKWSARNNSYFRSSHRSNLTSSSSILLPIQHFRFSGSLYKKLKLACKIILTTITPLIIDFWQRCLILWRKKMVIFYTENRNPLGRSVIL